MKNKKYNENKFYVYAYMNPMLSGEFVYGKYFFTHQPIYIGKGCGDRVLQHKNRFSIDGLPSLYVVFDDNMNEKKALSIERKLIKKFKIKLDGGTLENLNYGMTKNKKKISGGFIHFSKMMFIEEENRLSSLQKTYLKKLSFYKKGSLVIKKRGVKKYGYLNYRECKSVKSEYIGNIESKKFKDLKKSIKDRNVILSRLQRVAIDLVDAQRINYLLRD